MMYMGKVTAGRVHGFFFPKPTLNVAVTKQSEGDS